MYSSLSPMPNQLPAKALPFGSIENAHLGLIQPSHLLFLLAWRNAQLPILRQSKPLAMEEHLDYWKHTVWPDMKRQTPRQLLFSYQEGSNLVGYGGLVYIDWEKKSAEVSTLLNPKLSNSPEFVPTTRLYLQLSFELARSLNLKTLYTECFDTRLEMIGLLEELRFIRQGYQSNKKWIEFSRDKGFMAGSWSHSLTL